jgi:hypothetical protein
MIAGLVVVIVLVFQFIGVDLGFNASSTADYIAVLPAFIFLIAGLYIVVKVGGMFAFPALTMIGIGVAILLNTMYARGFVTVQMMSGLSIQSIMFWCVIISGMAGAVCAAVTAKR